MIIKVKVKPNAEKEFVEKVADRRVLVEIRSLKFLEWWSIERFISITVIINVIMKNTTIALRQDVKEKIMEFGNKGDTYSDIILNLLESAKKRQLQDLLMDEKDTLTIDEALSNAKKRWLK